MSAINQGTFQSVPYGAWPSGTYRQCNGILAWASGTPTTSGVDCFLPFLAPERRALATIGLWLVTAQTGAECHCGIYADGGGIPTGGLLSSDITLDLSSGTGSKIEGANSNGLVMQKGTLYWVRWMLKNVATQATVLRVSQGDGMFIANADITNTTSVNRYYVATSFSYASLGTAPAVQSSFGTDCANIWLKAA